MKTVYRLDRRFALQLFGWRMIVAGIGAILTFLGFGIGGFGRTLGLVFLAVTVVFLAVTVVFVVLAAWTMIRPPLVAALTAQGFRLGRMAEGGVRSGHWTTVEKVDTEQGRLIFRLESGEAGSIALLLLPRRAVDLQRDVHERLNAAHGYRRFPI